MLVARKLSAETIAERAGNRAAFHPLLSTFVETNKFSYANLKVTVLI